MKRVRLLVASLLTLIALLVGSVVFAQDAASTGFSSATFAQPVMSFGTAPQFGVLPARLRVWQ